MSLLFVGYDFEKINWNSIKQMFKKEGEEVEEKDDFQIVDKGIFSIADSAITSSAGTKTLLTGFRKVYDMEVNLWKPSFYPNGSFNDYFNIYQKVPFILGFAGSTLVAQHIMNSISGHLEHLEISCKEREGYEQIEYIITLPCEKNIVKNPPVYTEWDESTFLERDYENLLSGEYISYAIEHSVNHALKSARQHRLSQEEFNQMYTDIFCGFYCPILREHQIYVYRMKSKLEDGIFEVYTEKEKLDNGDIAVLGMRNSFEEQAKSVYLEEIEKENPNITDSLIKFMDECIIEVHNQGSYEINKPIVYKSLDKGSIKKKNIQ